MFIPGRVAPTFLSRIVRKQAHEHRHGPSTHIGRPRLRLPLFRLFFLPRPSDARKEHPRYSSYCRSARRVIDRSPDSGHLRRKSFSFRACVREIERGRESTRRNSEFPKALRDVEERPHRYCDLNIEFLDLRVAIRIISLSRAHNISRS